MNEAIRHATNYYIQNFLAIRNKFIRNLPISVVLIIIHTFQVYSIVINPGVISDFSLPEKTIFRVLNLILQVANIAPLFQQEETDNMIILVDIAFIIFVIEFALIAFLIKKDLVEDKQKNTTLNLKGGPVIQEIPLKSGITNQNNSNTAAFLITGSKVLLSYFIRTFVYLGNPTLCYSSLSIIMAAVQDGQLQSFWRIQGIVVSVLVLLMSILTSLFIQYHSFEFNYSNDDHLGAKSSIQSSMQFIFIYALIIACVFQSTLYTVTMLLGIAYTCFMIVVGHNNQLIRSFALQKVQVLLHGQFLIILIQLFIVMELRINTHYFSQLYLLASPLMFLMQLRFITYQENRLFLFDNDNITNLDDKLRYLHLQTKLAYGQTVKRTSKFNLQYKTIQLHSFVANHLRLCQLNAKRKQMHGKEKESKCFCFDFFPNQLQTQNKSWKQYTQDDFDPTLSQGKDEFVSEKQMKRFIYELIKFHYEAYFELHTQDSSNEMWYSYIYFVSVVNKYPTKAFYEALNLNNKAQFRSVKNYMIIKQLVNDAKTNFDKVIIKKNLQNQKYNLQLVFEFDMSMDIAKKNLVTAFHLFKKMYNTLLSQQINLDSIQQFGLELLMVINKIQLQLEITYSTNPLSSECDSILYIFYKYVNINSRRPKSLRRDSPQVFAFINSIQKDIFNKDSGVVYITLMQPRGTVKRYTKSFKKASGYSDLELMNQNIKQFMPEILSIHHDMYLNNFIEKGRMNIVMADNRFLLIKNKNKFILPVNAKIRLENYSTEDFGASALITRINLQMYYLVVNKFGLLEELTENFYKEVLLKNMNYDLKSLKGLDCLKLIPNLIQLWKTYSEDQDEQEDEGQEAYQGTINIEQLMEGFIIIPKQLIQYEILMNNKRQILVQKYKRFIQQQEIINKDYFSKIHDATVYAIKYKVIEMKTINMNLKILEIQHIKQLKSQQREKAMHIIKNNIIAVNDNKINSTSDIIPKALVRQTMQVTVRASTVHEDLENLNDCQLIEDFQMVDAKYSNLETAGIRTLGIYTQGPEANLLSMARNDQGLLMDIQQHSSSNFEMVAKESLGEQNRHLHQSLESADSLGRDSSSKKEIGGGQMQDAASVASSQAHEDQRSKKRMIREILLPSTTDLKNDRQHSLLFILVLIFLITCYCVNFGEIYVSTQALKIATDAVRIPQKLSILMNDFIVTSYLTQSLPNLLELQKIQLTNFMNEVSVLQKQDTHLDFALEYYNEVIIYQDELERNSSNVSIYYALNLMIYQMSSHLIRNDGDTFFITNFQNINETFLDLNATLSQQFVDYQDMLHQIELVIFSISETFIGISLMCIFPVLVVIRRRRRQIIELFCTFSLDQLQAQFQIYHRLILQCEQLKFLSAEANEDNFEKSNILQITKNLKNSEQGKGLKMKKNKGRYIQHSIAPFLIQVALFIIVFFFLFSGYMITSYVVSEDFINFSQNIYSDMLALNSMQNLLAQRTAFEVMILLSAQQNKQELLYEGNILETITQASINKDQFDNFMQYLTSNSQSDYPEIQTILSENACSLFQSSIYAESTKIINILTEEQCIELTPINQGISVALVLQNNQGIEFLQGASNQQSIEQLNEYALEYAEQMKLDQFALRSIYIEYIQMIVSDYLFKESQSAADQHIQVQIIIFGFGIMMMITIFYFSQKYFSKLLMNQISKSKQLLSILPFDMLLENSYVMTFITSESRKIFK